MLIARWTTHGSISVDFDLRVSNINEHLPHRHRLRYQHQWLQCIHRSLELNWFQLTHRLYVILPSFSGCVQLVHSFDSFGSLFYCCVLFICLFVCLFFQGKYGHLVEIGRVVVINYGELSGKVAVILDIVDSARALIDGPFNLTGVRRQTIPLRNLSLTKIKLEVLRGARPSTLEKAFIKVRRETTHRQTKQTNKQTNRHQSINRENSE